MTALMCEERGEIPLIYSLQRQCWQKMIHFATRISCSTYSFHPLLGAWNVDFLHFSSI